MTIATTFISRGSSMYYSLEEMVNNRLRSLEADKAEIIEVKYLNDKQAYIVYKI